MGGPELGCQLWRKGVEFHPHEPTSSALRPVVIGKALDANALTEKAKRYLTTEEVRAVMARRDKIVEHFREADRSKKVRTKCCTELFNDSRKCTLN